MALEDYMVVVVIIKLLMDSSFKDNVTDIQYITFLIQLVFMNGNMIITCKPLTQLLIEY